MTNKENAKAEVEIKNFLTKKQAFHILQNVYHGDIHKFISDFLGKKKAEEKKSSTPKN